MVKENQILTIKNMLRAKLSMLKRMIFIYGGRPSSKSFFFSVLNTDRYPNSPSDSHAFAAVVARPLAVEHHSVLLAVAVPAPQDSAAHSSPYYSAPLVAVALAPCYWPLAYAALNPRVTRPLGSEGGAVAARVLYYWARRWRVMGPRVEAWALGQHRKWGWGPWGVNRKLLLLGGVAGGDDEDRRRWRPWAPSWARTYLHTNIGKERVNNLVFIMDAIAKIGWNSIAKKRIWMDLSLWWMEKKHHGEIWNLWMGFLNIGRLYCMHFAL